MEGVGAFIQLGGRPPFPQTRSATAQLPNTFDIIGWRAKDRSGLRGSKVGVDDGNARFTGPRDAWPHRGRHGEDQRLRLDVGKETGESHRGNSRGTRWCLDSRET